MNKFTIEFTQEDMQVLQAALVELPFRIAAPLIDNINKQIQAAFDASADAKSKKALALVNPSVVTPQSLKL